LAHFRGLGKGNQLHVHASSRKHGRAPSDIVTKFSKRLSRVVCSFVVVGLLTAQAAFATQPCATPEMSAARAISGHMDADCDLPAVSASGLCVAKCADSDKLSSYTTVSVPPPPNGKILLVPVVSGNTPAMAALRRVATRALDPPKAIRFCTFLI
jgi:hypothetical protein